jgi:hypothetical protein
MKNALVSIVLVLATLPVLAEDRSSQALPLPTYVQECGSCHLAYAPGLLPAGSWQHLMANLPRHFGSDASLDPAAQASLTAWLSAHAASGKRARSMPPEDRISRAEWFVREHREVSAAVWKRKAIGSASNCAACHAGAAQGDFDEDAVSIPH